MIKHNDLHKFYKVCAWCKKVMSVTLIKSDQDTTSHGICPTCKEEVFKDVFKKK